MKYYTFYREDNKFDDIINDINLKKVVDEKIRWYQYLMIGISENQKNVEQTQSYITLKYGDDIVTALTKNYAPVAGVDYIPEKDKNKFSKSIS